MIVRSCVLLCVNVFDNADHSFTGTGEICSFIVKLDHANIFASLKNSFKVG